MAGAVELLYESDHKPKKGILSSFLQKKRNHEFKKIDGIRVEFCPNLFFELSENEQIKRVNSELISIIKQKEIKYVFVENYVKNRFEFSDELLISTELSRVSKIPSKVVVLYKDALKGLPLIAELKNKGIEVITWKDIIMEFTDLIPSHSWVSIEKNIYPIEIPKPNFKKYIDFALIDCPSRNLSMMPNGLGYVHNAIKRTDVEHTVYDLDIIAYHRFHIHRIYNVGGEIVLPSGNLMPKDPWQAENYDVWDQGEVAEFMYQFIQDIVDEICGAEPKILGMSIQQCNTTISTMVAREVKKRSPSTIIIVGGFSCYNPSIGLSAFPLADYMCIGEADLTVADLVTRLINGEEVYDLPGVLSQRDTLHRIFIPAPMENNLDKLEDPRYEWFPLSIYRNWDGYQLTPVIASRGCRWSRCTFCAERFYWRIKSPNKFVDELEYLVSEGCHLFMFNESDLNGSPEKVMEICDEIIKRNLKIKLTAQLRIHKKCDRAFYQKLAAAGFVALRFGVDAFSENTLRLQKKGYKKDTIRQNLKDCWESGIYTEVNWVIGVPGETEEDCVEGVDFILENRDYIGRVANINPLILVNGSVYWIDPESHGIRFKGKKEEILTKNDRNVPSSLWYSIDPFIDSEVRKRRFEDIITSLIDGGFVLGPWAQKIYAEVKHNRDKARA